MYDRSLFCILQFCFNSEYFFCFWMNIRGKKVVCTLFIHGTQIVLLCLHLCSDFKSFMAASCLSVIIIIADKVYFVLHHYAEI